MNDFTKGDWRYADKNRHGVTPRFEVYESSEILDDRIADLIRNESDANLIATAGNVANALDDKNIDAVEAIKVLPELLEWINRADGGCAIAELHDLQNIVDDLKIKPTPCPIKRKHGSDMAAIAETERGEG